MSKLQEMRLAVLRIKMHSEPLWACWFVSPEAERTVCRLIQKRQETRGIQGVTAGQRRLLAAVKGEKHHDHLPR